MFKLTFLSASLPLTKTIELCPDGTLYKTPYPLVANFTSHTAEINTIGEFHKLLLKYAVSPQKPCLLKGTLTRELTCESRKGTTQTNDSTSWVCLDLDRAPFSSPEEVMRALGLDDVSYVAQYSSSYKVDKKDKRLSCHVFFVLTRPLAAPLLKSWLMHMNQSVPVLEKAIELSKSAAALHWPLDITTCQSDKLLYTAMPVFKGMISPIKEADRITLVSKKLPALPIERLELKPIETLKKKAQEKLNQLRTDAGFIAIKTKTRMVGEYEVQSSVGEIGNYQVIDCGEYNRLNLNDGDSQAYWHHKSDTTYLHNFKGEPSLLLKEVLPHYYADLIRNAKNTNATPSAAGDLLLAFREKVTATYYKGTWNPDTQVLDMNTVKSELQLDHFLQGHGQSLGAFIPEWQIVFNPHNPVIVDEVGKMINTFVPTEYMQAGKKNKKGSYPVIQRIMDSCIGTGEIQDHFVNWLAVVWQQKKKPLTAWALHGEEGTGKGLLFHNVLKPLFGSKHAVQKRAAELNSQFNGWVESALIAFIDEIDSDMFLNAKAVEADLRTMITEPTISIRRMRTDSYEVPNYTAFIFASNKKRPIRIPQGDRRFNIGVFQHVKLVISQDEIDTIEDELSAFANMLSVYKADFHRAKTVLQTADRAAIQRLSVTSVDSLASDLLHGNLVSLWEAMPDESLLESAGMISVTAAAYSAMVRRFIKEPMSKITQDELVVIFTHCIGEVPKGSRKMTAFLAHHGLEMKRLRFGNSRPYGIEVAWVMTKDDRDDMTADLARTAQPKMKRVK